MASANTNETTPLLRDETGDAAPVEAPQSSETTVAAAPARPVFIDHAILRAFQLVLVVGCLSLPFNVASFVMAGIARTKYDYYDYYDYEQGSFAFLIVVSLLLALANVTWLRRVDHGFKDIFNIVVGGWLGFVVAAYMGNNMMRKATPSYGGCNNERWSPEKTERCKEWVSKYDAVNWVYLVLSCITGVVLALAALGTLVKGCMVLSRRNANNGSSRWTATLPALQLSLHVDFRLGSHQDRRSEQSSA